MSLTPQIMERTTVKTLTSSSSNASTIGSSSMRTITITASESSSPTTLPPIQRSIQSSSERDGKLKSSDSTIERIAHEPNRRSAEQSIHSTVLSPIELSKEGAFKVTMHSSPRHTIQSSNFTCDQNGNKIVLQSKNLNQSRPINRTQIDRTLPLKSRTLQSDSAKSAYLSKVSSQSRLSRQSSNPSKNLDQSKMKLKAAIQNISEKQQQLKHHTLNKKHLQSSHVRPLSRSDKSPLPADNQKNGKISAAAQSLTQKLSNSERVSTPAKPPLQSSLHTTKPESTKIEHFKKPLTKQSRPDTLKYESREKKSTQPQVTSSSIELKKRENPSLIKLNKIKGSQPAARTTSQESSRQKSTTSNKLYNIKTERQAIKSSSKKLVEQDKQTPSPVDISVNQSIMNSCTKDSSKLRNSPEVNIGFSKEAQQIAKPLTLELSKQENLHLDNIAKNKITESTVKSRTQESACGKMSQHGTMPEAQSVLRSMQLPVNNTEMKISYSISKSSNQNSPEQEKSIKLQVESKKSDQSIKDILSILSDLNVGTSGDSSAQSPERRMASQLISSNTVSSGQRLTEDLKQSTVHSENPKINTHLTNFGSPRNLSTALSDNTESSDISKRSVIQQSAHSSYQLDVQEENANPVPQYFRETRNLQYIQAGNQSKIQQPPQESIQFSSKVREFKHSPPRSGVPEPPQSKMASKYQLSSDVKSSSFQSGFVKLSEILPEACYLESSEPAKHPTDLKITSKPPIPAYRSPTEEKIRTLVDSKAKYNHGPKPTNATEDQRAEALIAHNSYRDLHHVGRLVLDPTLNSYAQRYAETLARNNSELIHSEGPYGENLYMSNADTVEIASALEAWYSENVHYTYGRDQPKNFSQVGHFTQMVWKETKKVGFGKARGKQGFTYIVAVYSPPGNYTGKYSASVFKP